MKKKSIKVVLALLVALVCLMMSSCTGCTGCNPTDDSENTENSQHNNTTNSIQVGGVTDSPITRVDTEKILFGSYPQSLVTDNELITQLNGIAGESFVLGDAEKWTDYGYIFEGDGHMWYVDVVNGTERYRGVYFNASRTESQAYNNYTSGNTYWFKYEPISWTVLSEEDGTAFLLCDMIIDAQEYQFNCQTRKLDPFTTQTYVAGTDKFANNYEYSTIRKWLNDNFYNTAFNEIEKDLILTTIVDNSVDSTDCYSNNYVCQNTNDKIFLLSAKEAIAEEYGFSKNATENDSARRKMPTEYAKCQGAYVFNVGSNKNGFWILRSPCYNMDDSVYRVNPEGHLRRKDMTYNGVEVYTAKTGIVPALKISLTTKNQ